MLKQKLTVDRTGNVCYSYSEGLAKAFLGYARNKKFEGGINNARKDHLGMYRVQAKEL